MNYAAVLGTDWTHLEPDRARLRAFALGIAEVDGTAPEGELERLVATGDSAYDRHLTEMAYQEGRRFRLGGDDGTFEGLPDYAQELAPEILDEIDEWGHPEDTPEVLSSHPLVTRREERPSMLELPSMLDRRRDS